MKKILINLTFALLVFAFTLTGSALAKDNIQANELLSLIADAKGKQVVLVNFYASWCPPCNEEIPHLIQLREKYSEDELIMIGINLDQDASTMKKFNKKTGLNYTTFHDTGAIQNLYNISAIPFTVVYGKKGNTIYAEAGYVDAKTLIKTVQYGMK